MRKSAIRDFFVEAPLLKEIRKNLIPQSVRDSVKSMWMMQKKPELESENIIYLKSVFNQDLQKLGDWLGVEELNCDNYKQTVTQSDSLNWKPDDN